jgi:hypothetical protein
MSNVDAINSNPVVSGIVREALKEWEKQISNVCHDEDASVKKATQMIDD